MLKSEFALDAVFGAINPATGPMSGYRMLPASTLHENVGEPIGEKYDDPEK